MRLSRARFVTVCQQSLVTGVVLVVAVSAAGVRTLDIVPSPGSSAAVPQQVLQRDAAPQEAVVATEPAEPVVREVAVDEVVPATRRPAAPPTAAASTGPDEADGAAGSRTAPEPTATPTIDGRRVVAESEPTEVRGFATVGLTWDDKGANQEYDADEIDVQVRTQKDGTWTGWAPVEYHDEHGPDAAEAARALERAGTEPVVVGDVDQVQVRAATADGSAPTDLELAVIDPGESGTAVEQPALEPEDAPVRAATPATDEDASGASDGADDTVVLEAARSVAKPTIYSRAQWGADERLRDGSPSYGTIQTGFIHHTVNANNYTEASVPSLIRGIYAYHTQARGWSDIGYNFLVDRFGRIWEGRYGGVDRAVVGAHTSGYNSSSFAMSAIGNFDITTPPQAVVDAYSRLFAWKLSLAGVKANATGIRLGSRTFQGINGHRDAGSTACPGRYLYAKLPEIRTAATKIQNGANATPRPTPTPTPTPSPAPVTTAPLVRLTSPTQAPARWTTQKSGLTFDKVRSVLGSTRPDVVLKRADGRLVVLPTGGVTGFTQTVRSGGYWGSKDLVAAVGDLTGDGRPDVVSRGTDKVVRVHAGRADGTVAALGTALEPSFDLARAVVSAGDWNGDGRSDLLVHTVSGKLVLWYGTGSTTLKAGPMLARSWSATSTAVVGDLTGDGRGDVVAVNRGRVEVFPGLATSLGARTASVAPEGGVTRVLGGSGRLGDLTGDGKADVVAVVGDTARVLPGNGAGALAYPWGPYSLPSGTALRSVGQLAGGEQGDLVGTDGDELVVGVHNGLRSTLPLRTTNVTVAGATQVLSVGDWDGDGHGDVMTRENGRDRLVLRLGDGTGRFAAPIALGSGWAPVSRLAAVGDVTGDGRADLLGVRRNGRAVVFPGKPRGLHGPVTAPTTLAAFGVVGTGSFKPGTPTQRIANPDGSYVPAGNAGIPTLRGYDLVVGPGDVDGDGRADLVARETSTGRVFLLPGTSAGIGARTYLGTTLSGYPIGG